VWTSNISVYDSPASAVTPIAGKTACNISNGNNFTTTRNQPVSLGGLDGGVSSVSERLSLQRLLKINVVHSRPLVEKNGFAQRVGYRYVCEKGKLQRTMLSLFTRHLVKY